MGNDATLNMLKTLKESLPDRVTPAPSRGEGSYAPSQAGTEVEELRRALRCLLNKAQIHLGYNGTEKDRPIEIAATVTQGEFVRITQLLDVPESDLVQTHDVTSERLKNSGKIAMNEKLVVKQIVQKAKKPNVNQHVYEQDNYDKE